MPILICLGLECIQVSKVFSYLMRDVRLSNVDAAIEDFERFETRRDFCSALGMISRYLSMTTVLGSVACLRCGSMSGVQ